MCEECTNDTAAAGLELSTTPALLSYRPIYSLFFGSGKKMNILAVPKHHTMEILGRGVEQM
jgi:hypothetical protein